MKRFNVSDDLANYMALVLDPASGNFYSFMTKRASGLVGFAQKEDFMELKENLDQILFEHNMDLLELFYALAIDCEGFVIYCEVGQDQLLARGTSDSSEARYCCGSLFNTKPTFTNAGVCYTTNATVVGKQASLYDGIKVWVFMNYQDTPEYKMKWKGSDAVERRGFVWTITDQDIPAVSLSHNLHKSQPGTTNLVRIRRTEIDRSNLHSLDTCLDINETFVELSGNPSTKRNCQGMISHFLYENCSVGYFFGYKTWEDLKPCKPHDVISKPIIDLSDLINQNSECFEECRKVSHMSSVTTSEIDFIAFNKSINAENNPTQYNVSADANESSALVLYFESFDYSVNVMTQRTYLDLFSQLGGTIGLAIGASMITIVEMFYFLGKLFKIMFKDGFGKESTVKDIKPTSNGIMSLPQEARF